MKRRYLVRANILCICILAGHAAAQLPDTSRAIAPLLQASNTETTPSTAEFTFRRNVEEAGIRFVAVDARGTPVQSLEASDIQLYDDREMVSEVTSLSMSGHQPLIIGLMVDLSDSIDPEQRQELTSTLDKLAQAIEPGHDRAFAIGFSKTTEMIQGITPDVSLIRDSVSRKKGKQGLTALFDSLIEACEHHFPTQAVRQQRIMLLFSDGVDTLSSHGLDDATQAALRAGVTIYALTDAYASRDGFRTLQILAQKTGGNVFPVRKKADIALAVAALSESLRDEYSVTFRPASARRGFHPIRLELRSNKAAGVRAASGYFFFPD